jgi:hypothetical protein
MFHQGNFRTKIENVIVQINHSECLILPFLKVFIVNTFVETILNQNIMKMVNENIKSFTYSLKTIKSPKEIFKLLLDVNKWWSGFHKETITGKSSKINDEFSFWAGDGVHFSKQRLIELEPHSKIVWMVTESNLTFLDDPNEWLNTKIRFDITKQGENTIVTFTHEDLVPRFECYDSCSMAWTAYMENLRKMLN